jgi:hypothetical protein
MFLSVKVEQNFEKGMLITCSWRNKNDRVSSGKKHYLQGKNTSTLDRNCNLSEGTRSIALVEKWIPL